MAKNTPACHPAQRVKALEMLTSTFLNDVAANYLLALNNARAASGDPTKSKGAGVFFNANPNEVFPLSAFLESDKPFLTVCTEKPNSQKLHKTPISKNSILQQTGVIAVDEEGKPLGEAEAHYRIQNKDASFRQVTALLTAEDLLADNGRPLALLHDKITTFFSREDAPEVTGEEKMAIIRVLVDFLKVACSQRDKTAQAALHDCFTTLGAHALAANGAFSDALTGDEMMEILLGEKYRSITEQIEDFDVEEAEHIAACFPDENACRAAQGRLITYLTENPALLRAAHHPDAAKRITDLLDMANRAFPTGEYDKTAQKQLLRALFQSQACASETPNTFSNVLPSVLAMALGQLNTHNLKHLAEATVNHPQHLSTINTFLVEHCSSDIQVRFRAHCILGDIALAGDNITEVIEAKIDAFIQDSEDSEGSGAEAIIALFEAIDPPRAVKPLDSDAHDVKNNNSANHARRAALLSTIYYYDDTSEDVTLKTAKPSFWALFITEGEHINVPLLSRFLAVAHFNQDLSQSFVERMDHYLNQDEDATERSSLYLRLALYATPTLSAQFIKQALLVSAEAADDYLAFAHLRGPIAAMVEQLLAEGSPEVSGQQFARVLANLLDADFFKDMGDNGTVMEPMTDDDAHNLVGLTELLQWISEKKEEANTKADLLITLYCAIYQAHEGLLKRLFAAPNAGDYSDALVGLVTELGQVLPEVTTHLRPAAESTIPYTPAEDELARIHHLVLYKRVIETDVEASEDVAALFLHEGAITPAAQALFSEAQRLNARAQNHSDKLGTLELAKLNEDKDHHHYLNARLTALYKGFTPQQRGQLIDSLSHQLEEIHEATANIESAIHTAHYKEIARRATASPRWSEQDRVDETPASGILEAANTLGNRAISVKYSLAFFFEQLSTVEEVPISIEGQLIERHAEALTLLFQRFPDEQQAIFDAAIDEGNWGESCMTPQHILHAFTAFSAPQVFTENASLLAKILKRFDDQINSETAITLLALTHDLLQATENAPLEDNTSAARKQAAAAKEIRRLLMEKALRHKDLLRFIKNNSLREHIQHTLRTLKRAHQPARLSDDFLADNSLCDKRLAAFRTPLLFAHLKEKRTKAIKSSQLDTASKLALLASESFEEASGTLQNRLFNALIDGKANQGSIADGTTFNGLFEINPRLTNLVAGKVVRRQYEALFTLANFRRIAHGKTKAALFLAGYNNRNAIEQGLFTKEALWNTTEKNKRFKSRLESIAQAEPEIIATILAMKPSTDDKHLFSLQQLRDVAHSDLPRLLVKPVTPEMIAAAINNALAGPDSFYCEASSISKDYDASTFYRDITTQAGSEHGLPVHVSPEIAQKALFVLNKSRTESVRALFIQHDLDVEVAKGILDNLAKDGNLLVSDIISIFIERSMLKKPLNSAIADHLMHYVMTGDNTKARWAQFSHFAQYLDDAAVEQYKHQLLNGYIAEYKKRPEGQAIMETFSTPIAQKEAFLAMFHKEEIASRPSLQAVLEKDFEADNSAFLENARNHYRERQAAYTEATKEILEQELTQLAESASAPAEKAQAEREDEPYQATEWLNNEIEQYREARSSGSGLTDYQKQHDARIAERAAQKNPGEKPFYYNDLAKSVEEKEAEFKQQAIVDTFLNYAMLDAFAAAKENIFLAAQKADKHNLNVRLGRRRNRVQMMDLTTEQRLQMEHGFIMNAWEPREYNNAHAEAIANRLAEKTADMAHSIAEDDSKNRLQHTPFSHYAVSGETFEERKASLHQAFHLMRAKSENRTHYRTLNMTFKATVKLKEDPVKQKVTLDKAEAVNLALQRGKKELQFRTAKLWHIHLLPEAILLSIKKLFNGIAYRLSTIDTSRVSEDEAKRTKMDKLKVALQAFGEQHTTKFFTMNDEKGQPASLTVTYSEPQIQNDFPNGGVRREVIETQTQPRFVSKSAHGTFFAKARDAFNNEAERKLAIFRERAQAEEKVTQPSVIHLK